MKSKKIEVITCPACGREYLPSEIYLPNNFLGKVDNVIRMVDGKIDTFFGNTMDLKETYVCDKCNMKFNVLAKVSFKTSKANDNNFKEEYITKVNNKIKLSED